MAAPPLAPSDMLPVRHGDFHRARLRLDRSLVRFAGDAVEREQERNSGFGFLERRGRDVPQREVFKEKTNQKVAGAYAGRQYCATLQACFLSP